VIIAHLAGEQVDDQGLGIFLRAVRVIPQLRQVQIALPLK